MSVFSRKIKKIMPRYIRFHIPEEPRITFITQPKLAEAVGTGIRVKPEHSHLEGFYTLPQGAETPAYVESAEVTGSKLISVLSELVAVLNPVKVKKQIGHPFHLVTPSVLPFTMSLAFLCVFQNFLGFMWFEGWHFLPVYFFHAAFFANFFAVILTWIMEVFKEEQSGSHTVEIQKGFQYAILLFILSELMLFFSFFWAYFHFTLNASSFTGGAYVPEGLVIFFWYRIPLLNTLLLLASGLSLTIGHILLVEADKVYKLKIWINLIANFYVTMLLVKVQEVKKNSSLLPAILDLIKLAPVSNYISGFTMESGSARRNICFITTFTDEDRFPLVFSRFTAEGSWTVLPKLAVLKYKRTTESVFYSPSFWVLDTVFKGFVFLMYQAYEYTSSMFAINDSVYGAVFFSLTGLHGLHVFVGVMFLLTFVLINLAKEITIAIDQDDIIARNRHDICAVRVGRRATRASSYEVKYFTHRIAFDGAAWYWHFVDVVWLFVFVFVYWWGFAG